ncbi:class I adenylate-forming enzyme family protein, partial [Peribacillus frigoritolerans]
MLHKLTFQSLMNKGMKRFGDLPAITLLPNGETITYDELWKKTERITSYLMRSGAGRGVRIATIIPNSLESVMFGLAVQQCGATLVPLSEKLGKREIQFILKEAKPEVVIIATQTHFDT